MIDLNMLFVPDSSIRRFTFGSAKEELEAVQSRKKGMSVFSCPRSDVEGFKDLSEMALDLGLSVMHHIDPVTHEGLSCNQMYIFILYSEESWRVPAYLLTKEVLWNYTWSDSAENLISALLGYDQEQIASWLARINESRASWSGKTFYLLMSRQQQSLIARLGIRCIDPQSLIEPIIAFYNRKNSPVKKDAYEMLPHNLVIGRVSAKEKVFRNLFGKVTSPDAPDVLTGAITEELAESLNPALDSNFQFLNADGWH